MGWAARTGGDWNTGDANDMAGQVVGRVGRKSPRWDPRYRDEIGSALNAAE